MNKPHLNLRRLALLVAAIYAPNALASAAARIEFAAGDPVIVSGDGRERPARKGEEIAPGDRVLTRSGRAQLAFTDGGFISLQPNSDFGVNEYTFNGRNDGSEKGVFSLLKGALRTVTGLIGRNKRDAYLMNTPTATIGIRGTGGRIEVNEQGTFIAGTSGIWFMTTLGGTVDIPAGSNGFAGPDRNQPPELGSAIPNTPPPGPPLPGFSSPEQVDSSGASSVITTPSMPGGSGYAVLHLSDLSGVPYLASSSTTSFSGSALISFTDAVAQTVAQGTTTIADAGNDGIIGWGRWTDGAYTINGTPQTPLNDKQSLHYVVGVPTASMPTTGSASYSVIGSTSPTLVSGTQPAGSLVSAALSVDFGLAEVNYSLLASVGGFTYSGEGTSQALGGPVNTYTFSNNTTGTACAGACGCSGEVKLLFTGTNATRAGITYSINGDVTGQTATGAVAFTR